MQNWLSPIRTPPQLPQNFSNIPDQLFFTLGSGLGIALVLGELDGVSAGALVDVGVGDVLASGLGDAGAAGNSGKVKFALTGTTITSPSCNTTSFGIVGFAARI